MLKFPNTNIHGYTGTNGLYKGISRRTITNSYVDPPIFVGGIHGGKPPVMAISSPLYLKAYSVWKMRDIRISEFTFEFLNSLLNSFLVNLFTFQ